MAGVSASIFAKRPSAVKVAGYVRGIIDREGGKLG
jgi:hypothetical protein